MDGGAAHLDAVLQSFLVDFEAVIAFAAEARDERRVDVDDPVRPLAREIAGQDAEVAREDDHVDVVLAEDLHEGLFIGFLTAALFLDDCHTGDAGVRGAGQRVGVLLAGDDHFDLSALDDAVLLRVDECLEVRASAGDEDCDVRLQHNSIFSSPLAMYPMT